MRNPQLEYQRQAVMNASPIKLIIKLYDLAIQASYSKNEKKLKDILSTLINGLNFDHEPAAQLFNLYRYCQELTREERYDEVREILEPLRDAWEESSVQAPIQNGTYS